MGLPPLRWVAEEDLIYDSATNTLHRPSCSRASTLTSPRPVPRTQRCSSSGRRASATAGQTSRSRSATQTPRSRTGATCRTSTTQTLQASSRPGRRRRAAARELGAAADAVNPDGFPSLCLVTAPAPAAPCPLACTPPPSTSSASTPGIPRGARPGNATTSAPPATRTPPTAYTNTLRALAATSSSRTRPRPQPPDRRYLARSKQTDRAMKRRHRLAHYWPRCMT